MRVIAALNASAVPNACLAGALGACDTGIRHKENRRQATPATNIASDAYSSGPRAQSSSVMKSPFKIQSGHGTPEDISHD
jgi:hypothetical protein